MKKILLFFQNWFEKNGLIKIIVTFIILFGSILIAKNSDGLINEIFGWTAIVSMGYLIITFLVLMISAIINTIKDIINKRNDFSNINNISRYF
jgi:hypothetical protein